MWVYQRNPDHLPIVIPKGMIKENDTAPDRWLVGWVFSDGSFKVVRAQTSERDAARVVHYLNGGDPAEWPPE